MTTYYFLLVKPYRFVGVSFNAYVVINKQIWTSVAPVISTTTNITPYNHNTNLLHCTCNRNANKKYLPQDETNCVLNSRQYWTITYCITQKQEIWQTTLTEVGGIVFCLNVYVWPHEKNPIYLFDPHKCHNEYHTWCRMRGRRCSIFRITWLPDYLIRWGWISWLRQSSVTDIY